MLYPEDCDSKIKLKGGQSGFSNEFVHGVTQIFLQLRMQNHILHNRKQTF